MRFKPLLLVLVLGFLAAPLASPVRAQESADSERLRALALDPVNKARTEHNLPPLQIGKAINEAAKYHAGDMARRNFYGHNSPEGKTVVDRFRNAGGSQWQMTGENIARCTGCDVSVKTLEDLQRGWMNSKPHRENILRNGFGQFGFSMVGAPGRTVYAVQTFTGAGVSSGFAANEPGKRISEAQVAAEALQFLNKERKAAGSPAIKESPALTRAVRAMLPQTRIDEFSLSQIGKVSDVLAADERRNWGSLVTLAASCGACGAELTDADVRHFMRQWLAKDSNKAEAMDAATTHLGFAVAASGQGKKIALAVLAKKPGD